MFHLYQPGATQRAAEIVGADAARLAQLIAQHAPPAPAAAPAAAASAAPAGGSGGGGGGAPNAATTAEMQAAIMKALADLRGAVSDMPEFITSVRTLLTFVGNMVGHPGEAKYRRVRLTNATFQTRLGRHHGGVAAMEAFGFRREGAGRVVCSFACGPLVRPACVNQ
jgi:hypothetical protein